MNQISSNHLKLLKLLVFIDNKSINWINFFLEPLCTELHIKEIYKIIFPNKKNKVNIMIKDILTYNNAFLELKKFQILLKEERKFFMILELLINKNLNLNEIAKKLSLNRRTLNYDLIEIKESLLDFNLFIESKGGKGIFLKGNYSDIKNASFHYFYKFLTEEKFLPNIFIDNFYNFFYNPDEFILLKKDINNLVNKCNLNIFFYAKELLISFYLSYKCLTFNNSLKEFSNFESYFSEIFSNKELKIFSKIFKKSILRNVDYEGILFLIELLKILNGNIPDKSFSKKSFIFWNKFFLENFGEVPNFEEIKVLKKLILRINYINNHFPIYFSNLSFLNLHIEKSSLDKSIILFQYLKKYYKNILFNDVVLLFLLMQTFTTAKKNVTIIYKDTPKYIISGLKKKLEMKYNIKIIDIIHMDTLENSKHIQVAGIFCDIDLTNFKFKVLKLKI